MPRLKQFRDPGDISIVSGSPGPLFSGENIMGRHHVADHAVIDLAVVVPAPRIAPEAAALRSTPFPVIPAPRRAPEPAPAPVAVPEPRGWRARRAAKADAASARAQAVAVAHAERRARQVALASLTD